VQKSFNTNIQTYCSIIKAQYLLNPKTYYHIHTILPVFPILSYKNSVHILIQYFLNIPHQYFLLFL